MQQIVQMIFAFILNKILKEIHECRIADTFMTSFVLTCITKVPFDYFNNHLVVSTYFLCFQLIDEYESRKSIK